MIIYEHESMTIKDDMFDLFMNACAEARKPNKALVDAVTFTKGGRMIIATCGHEIENLKDGVELTIKDYTGDSKGDIVKCLSRGLYCQKCAGLYRRNGYVLENKEAEEEWLKE